MVVSILFVGAGALAGGLLRYGMTVWIQSIWTIVAINLIGSFVLGVLTHTTSLSMELRNGIGVGFLGGFTTFSTLTVQTVLEADGGRPGRAAAYLLLSVVGGLIAAALGYVLGRAVA